MTDHKYYKFTGTEYKNVVWNEINPNQFHSLSYGDFEEVTGTPANLSEVYIIPEVTSGGDYDNSGAIERSNHRTLLKRFKKVTGVHDLYGGYGTFAIAIRADVAESNEEIKEVLDGLENYPVIDGEDLSSLEDELYNEAWDQWVGNEVKKELIKVLDPYNITEEQIDEIDLEKYYQLVRFNDDIDYRIEAGGSTWMKTDKVAEAMSDLILLDHCKEFPLLIGYKWHSEESQSEFETKFKGEKNVQCKSR
jgi:hypothetical protein